MASRPLPKGEYLFNRHDTPLMYLACNHTLTDQITVTVTAPAGTLHELFFDPVAVVRAQGGPSLVAADAAIPSRSGVSGVLKPPAFTDANGASATISRIAYEPGAGSGAGAGTVWIAVSPHTGLSEHSVDFIELDGTVSLSLDVDAAAMDAADETLNWAVSSQPWHDGDKLMVRIRQGSPAPTPTPMLTATPAAGS